MTKDELIEFGTAMEMEGRGYFFESCVSRSELEGLPEPLRGVCLQLQDALGALDSAFVSCGVDPEEFEC